MLREKELWEFPVPVGGFVVFRHNAPWPPCDEPHQLPATVGTVKPSKKGFNVSIKTDGGERFLIKGVNRDNFSLVFEP